MKHDNFTTNSDLFERRYDINQTLLLISLYTLMPSGVFMNLTQILVYLGKKFSKNSMSVYLIAISLNNIFILISTSLRFANAIKTFSYVENTDIGCRLAQFFIRYFYNSCSWLNFLFSFDRLIFILYPNKFKRLQTKLNNIKFIISMYALLFILNCPSLFFTNAEIFNQYTNESILICVASPLLSISREAAAQFFGMYIPILLIFITNLVLIKKVSKSRQKLGAIKEINFAFALIISNILFLISFIPFSALLIAIILVTINPTLPMDPRIGSILALYETCAFIIACYNYSFGLLVQLAFNKLFRKEFLSKLAVLFSVLKIKNIISVNSSTK